MSAKNAEINCTQIHKKDISKAINQIKILCNSDDVEIVRILDDRSQRRHWVHRIKRDNDGKWSKLVASSRKRITVYEAMNRTATNFVIANSIRRLFKEYDLDELRIDWGNSNKLHHDTVGFKDSNEVLYAECTNCSEGYRDKKVREMVAKLQKSESRKNRKAKFLIVLNKDCKPNAINPALKRCTLITVRGDGV